MLLLTHSYSTLTNLMMLHLLQFIQLQFRRLLRMPPTNFSARTDTADHGLLRPFTGPVAVANGLTDLKIVLVKCLFTPILNRIHCLLR